MNTSTHIFSHIHTHTHTHTHTQTRISTCYTNVRTHSSSWVGVDILEANTDTFIRLGTVNWNSQVTLVYRLAQLFLVEQLFLDLKQIM